MQTIQNHKPDFASLLQPALHHQSPRAVLDDPDLEPFQKRAILSSWASDLYAVESCPWLREIPGVRGRLRLSDILETLCALDDEDEPPPGGASQRPVWRARTAVRAATA
jgi:hypothetical protein